MLATSNLNATLEENDLSTYFIIPFDGLKTSDDYGQLKILPDGTMYIISNENQEIDEKPEVPTSENENILVCSEQAIPVNSLSVIKKTEKVTGEKYLQPWPDGFPTDTETKYTCPKCECTFIIAKEYKEHLKWHKFQKAFKCSKCPAGYNVENNLKVHNELAHPSDSLLKSCPICGVGLTFKRAASLKSHLMVHQVEEVNSCEECDAEFEKEDEYTQHMMNHSTKNKDQSSSLTCSHCEVQFQTKQQLKLHISNHTKAGKYFKKKKSKRNDPKEKIYRCNHCKKCFIKQSLLERHERIHSGEKPFKCNICDQCFTQKGTLQIHLMKHTGNKPFLCTLCPAKFNQKGNLRVHIKKTHTIANQGQKMFQCPHCSCIFKRIASLNGHVTKAHRFLEENVISDVMMNLKELEEQNFDSYVTLTESTSDAVEKKYVVKMKKIKDIKWYRCTHCPKMCKKPSDLIRHIRVHTKERPFVCKICTKTFSLKNTLLCHMNAHCGTRKYNCESCSYSFSTARLLQSHEKKHERERKSLTWQCLTCGTLFDGFEQALQHKMVEEQPHKIQSVMNKVMKQPQYQTVYDEAQFTRDGGFNSCNAHEECSEENFFKGNLTFKPPRPKVPNTGAESAVPRPFHCTICDGRFTRKINLKRHIKGHEGDRRYKCNLCPKAFITSYRLKEHLNHHNNIKNYACKVCNKRFVTSTYLRRHMIIHSDVRPYTCPYCSKNFQTLDMNRRHIKIVHKKDVLAEVEKEETAIQANNDNGPIQTSVIMSSMNKVISTQCNQQSSLGNNTEGQAMPVDPSLTAQITHGLEITDSSGFQTFYVSLDDLQLMNSAGVINLNSLVEGLENPENFRQLPATPPSPKEACQTDAVLMYTNTTRTLGDQSTTGTAETAFDEGLNETRNIFDDASIICMNCNQMFSTFVEFQKHACAVNTTTNANKDVDSAKLYEIQDVQENVQEKITEVQDNLRQKEQLEGDKVLTENTSSNTFQCPICNKDFKSSWLSYRKHIKIHSSPFPKASTETKIDLGQTVLPKSRDSNYYYSCVFCMKKFKKPSDLKRHHRTHTGEKPYACLMCEKKFSLKATLKCHIRTHDPNQKKFSCGICDSFYSSKTSLKVHMTLHTGVTPHKCSICKAEFRTVGAKKSHETMGHRSTQKKKSKRSTKNRLTDMFKKVTELLPDSSKGVHDDVNNVLPEYVPFDNLGLVTNQNNLTTQTRTIDLPSQIAHLEVPPDIILSTTPVDQITVDSSNLLQQLQMTDMVLPANETGTVSPLILDDVTFLDMDTAASTLQIISLPESEGGAVTISIKENVDKVILKKNRTEKPKQAVACDICLKMLASKDGLRKHKKNVHGDKQKFACTKCQKKFETKEKLKNHEKDHLKVLSCSVCSMAFDSEKNLEEHVNSLHQVTEASKEQIGALLNLKLDLESAAMEDPLYNLFLVKKT